MNNYTLNLSSSSSNDIQHYGIVQLNDHTALNLRLDQLNQQFIPLFLRIDWGDGVLESFDNNIFPSSRSDIDVLSFNPILSEIYSHEYYPSSTSLYKSLTAQMMLTYSNLSSVWITIPLQIRTYDYFESIYDLKLINTNILPLNNNPKEHQLLTDKGGFTITVIK